MYLNMYIQIYQLWKMGGDFNNRMDEYKTSILTVTVLDNMNIPENAYQIFDVSKEQDGTVKAWIVPNEENVDRYDLYIGGTDGVGSEDCSYLFCELTNCIKIDLENLYTENATSFACMFYNDNNLEDINLKNLDSSEVTTMSNMFAECNNLKKLDLSNFNTRNLTNMGLMFFHCTSLESVDLSSFDTSSVSSMSQLFNGCKNIRKLDLENFDTSKLSTWAAGGYYMFAECTRLEELKISSWDVSNFVYMIGMFQNCNSLQSLDLSGWNTSNVINMNGMFYNCNNLKTIYVSEKWGNNAQVIESFRMFSGCDSLSGAIQYDSSKTDINYANYENGYFTCKE